VLLAVVLASAYGVTDELHQAFVPGRVPDPADWLVDTAGAYAGAATGLLLARRARRDR
jgi:VanZ family protein